MFEASTPVEYFGYQAEKTILENRLLRTRKPEACAEDIYPIRISSERGSFINISLVISRAETGKGIYSIRVPRGANP